MVPILQNGIRAICTMMGSRRDWERKSRKIVSRHGGKP
jgi:hypothetical protein